VKEAVYKALNASGVSGRGWLEAETLKGPNGAPVLTFSGRCKTALEAMTPDGYKASPFVSLSDEPPYALAFVIINAIPLEWTAPDE
jgi:holo-[acyl-carrier protein] synthase